MVLLVFTSLVRIILGEILGTPLRTKATLASQAGPGVKAPGLRCHVHIHRAGSLARF